MGTCIEFNFKDLYEKDYNVRSIGEISKAFFDAVSDAEIAADQFINFTVPAEGNCESERQFVFERGAGEPVYRE